MTAVRSQKIGRKRDGTAYELMKYILPKRIAQGRPLPQRKRDGTAYELMKYILPKRIAQGRPLPQQKTSLPFGSEALHWWR